MGSVFFNHPSQHIFRNLTGVSFKIFLSVSGDIRCKILMLKFLMIDVFMTTLSFSA